MKIFSVGVVLLAVASATVTAHAQDDGLPGRGRMLFHDQGCATCHTVGALGPPRAPDLSHVGSEYSAEYLRSWLNDPASRRPWAHMPKPQLTWPEIEALAEYLASRR
jgi:mono/diheme cytochrome c family protein